MTQRASVEESSNRSFYDNDSNTYDEQRWISKGGAFTNRVQQEILETLCTDWRSSRTLEVGSGTGRFTIPLLKKNNLMTLVDVSSGMLARAKNNIEAAGLGDQVEAYMQCSVYELPFEDESFDHVLSLNVFNHLERPGDALKQLSRVTRSGSTLLFNYANLHSYYWPAARRINQNKKAVGRDVYSSWERPRDMLKVIHHAGLELVCVIGHAHIPRAVEKYPVYSIVRLLDSLSRRGPFGRFAPYHFCMCRKRLSSPVSKDA